MSPSSTIWAVAIQGGTPKRITEAGKPPGGHGAPAWSPDGKRIAFTAYDLSKSPEVWTIATDGSDVTLIAQHAFEFVYAPDGRSIYFTGSSKDLGYGVWNVQIDSNGRTLSNPNKIFDPGATTIKHLSISGDGKRLIYASLLQTSNLWSVSLLPVSQEAVGSPTALTRENTYRSTGPAFSPDGRRIAYSAIRAGAGPNVWLMNSDGTNQTQLTSEGGGALSWSPDGNELVFTLQRDARAALWSVPIGGGKEKQVIDLGTDTSFLRLSGTAKS